MDIKKKFYTMKPDEFKTYLSNLKNDDSCVSIFEDTNPSYFFVVDMEINQALLNLNKMQYQLDIIFDSFTDVQKKMIRQSCLIDEIQSTNKTENIYSTRSDIFGILKDVASIHNKKIVSIINSYLHFNKKIDSKESVRMLYDKMMENAYDSSKDIPDGKIFRKNPVYVSDGLKTAHSGFYPETEIIKGIEEYIKMTQNTQLDIYLRLIVSHFMLETIHPFYDGNGRLGRCLMSMSLYQENSTIFSLRLATSINQEKEKYYDALKSGRDIHEFGCLNTYILKMCQIFQKGMENIINSLNDKKIILAFDQQPTFKMTKSEQKVYELLLSASVLTYYGISNDEIMDIIGISKRTCISVINKFRENNMLEEIKLGKKQYHRLNVEYLLKDE